VKGERLVIAAFTALCVDEAWAVLWLAVEAVARLVVAFTVLGGDEE
jgi:hypothetical protein